MSAFDTALAQLSALADELLPPNEYTITANLWTDGDFSLEAFTTLHIEDAGMVVRDRIRMGSWDDTITRETVRGRPGVGWNIQSREHIEP